MDDLLADTRLARRLVDEIPDCVKVLSPVGRLLAMNRSGRCLMEVDDFAAIAGADWASFWTGEDRTRAEEALRSARAGRTGRFRGFCPTRRGTPKWWDVAVSAIVDEQGRPEYLLSISRDVTAEHEAAVARDREIRQAQANEELLRLAQRAGGVGTFEWDLRTFAPRCSATYFEIFGIDRADLTTTAEEWRQMVHPDDREWMDRHLARAAAGEEPATADYRIVRPDGEERWVTYTGAILRDDDGRPARLVGTVMDVTLRKRAEAALREADRRKDEFLAMLGHELRNPLAPIVTALELQKLKDPAGSKERTIIERQVKHLRRLVDDLLDVSRITRGKVQLTRECVDVADAVRDAVDAASPLFEAKRHRLTVSVPADLFADADRVRLVQIVANLLTNAAKFTPPDGAVAVTASHERDAVVIAVRDTGAGIPAHMLDRVFDLFEQGERRGDAAAGGLGLGLTLVRTLSVLHGGRAFARSDGPGRGAEFVVELPAWSGARADVAATSAIDPPQPRAARVLLVDDNEDALATLADLLRLRGHDVVTAGDGPEALSVAGRARPDVAIVDIGLPGMNGYEVGARLRELVGRSLRLVAVTGYGQDHARRTSTEAGFDEHLVKPIDVAALTAALAAFEREAIG